MLKNQPCLLSLLLLAAFGLSSAHAEPGYTSNQNMMEILTSLEQLESEIRQMRGTVEEMSHELQDVRRRQRELYVDIDRRLRELELSGVRSSSPNASMSSRDSGVTSSVSRPSTINPSDNVKSMPNQVSRQTNSQGRSPVAAATTRTTSVAAPDINERKAYNKAFDLLKEGRYEQSIKAFQGFMEQYPQSGYADNAQYWLGEANYVSRKYKVAVEEFNKVINHFPSSPKVSGATLKLGFAYYELGDWKQSRQTLQKVLKQYPADTSARLAETRLQRMQSEGH
jgi:tol-pal system protein YbgF